MENAQNILTKLELKWGEVDARIVRVCCDTVSSRSARLCAAALATIANRIRTNRRLDHLKTTVGVDGTVYKKHPKWVDLKKDTRQEVYAGWWRICVSHS